MKELMIPLVQFATIMFFIPITLGYLISVVEKKRRKKEID